MESKALDSAPIWDCLTTFDGQPWRGKLDIIAAGYPCQPFSNAGKRQGEDDPRHLWPHVRRILSETDTPFLFCENVPGHLSRGFEQVCSDLEGLGYRVAAGLFSASEIGAPHKRERLYFLAHRAPPGGRALAYADSKGLAYGPPQEQVIASGWLPSERASLDGITTNPHGQGELLPAPRNQGGHRTQHSHRGTSQSRLFGLDDGMASGLESGLGDLYCPPEKIWTAENMPPPVAFDVPHRIDRIRLAGNGVVPQVAALAFTTLLEHHASY